MRPSDRALRRRRGGHRADDIGTAIIACSTSASRGLRGSRVLRVLELAHLPLPLPLPLPFDHVNAFACTFYVNKARTHGPDKRVSWMEESGGDTGRVLVSLGERGGGRGRHRVTKFQYHRHRQPTTVLYMCIYICVRQLFSSWYRSSRASTFLLANGWKSIWFAERDRRDAEEEVGSLWRTRRIYDYYGRIVVMYAMERTTYVLPVKDGKLAASGTRRWFAIKLRRKFFGCVLDSDYGIVTLYSPRFASPLPPPPFSFGAIRSNRSDARYTRYSCKGKRAEEFDRLCWNSE